MSDAVPWIARSSIVLLAGLIAAMVLKKQPASLRHWIVAAALAVAALQPAIALFVPALPVSLGRWNTAVSTAATGGTVESSFVIGVAAPVIPATAPFDWSRAVFGVWLAGVVANLAALVVGVLWLLWLGSRASNAGAEWYDAERSLRPQLGLRRSVRIKITTHPAIVVTWGAIAPVILLPAEARWWDADRRRLVLAHEIAHLVRQDWLTQLCAEVARSINWFNPLFWIACARLRRESEHACDDIVLDTGIAGTSYATHLVELARALRVHGRTWLPAPSIARPSTLERRVRAMLNPHLNRRPANRMMGLLLSAALCAIALPIAAAQAASTPSGTVVDPMGRPLANATVRLAAIANSEQAYETRTDANGAFRFNALPPAEYMLSLNQPGFSSGRQRLQLHAGEVTITLKAQVAKLQETVSVRGGGSGGNDAPRYQQSLAAPPAPSCSASAAGELTPPVRVHDVRPRYKQAWIDAGLEGNILMQARIGVDGRVRSVDALSQVSAELEEEAIATVSQWQFSPTYLNCTPIEAQMYVTVSFKIER